MVGMSGKSKEDSSTTSTNSNGGKDSSSSSKDKKRSLFKSLFSKPHHHQHNGHNSSPPGIGVGAAAAAAAPPSAEPDASNNNNQRWMLAASGVGGKEKSSASNHQNQDPRRASFQVFRPSPPAVETTSKRESAMPALGKFSPVAPETTSSNGNSTPPLLQDFSGTAPVLTAESPSEGLSLAIYLKEYRPHAASYPSASPTTPTAHINARGATTPVLRVDSASTALTGTLRVVNAGKPFVSPRLAVMLFTGQGRTGMPVNDPEAPSAAGLHSRPIARSATYIWKEPVLVEAGTNDFAFTLPLSGSIPPTLSTFSSLHSNRLDVWHSLFVKMRRTELEHVVSRQDLVIQKCLPESVKCSKKKTRNKTATGSIADGLIEFKAEGADMCDIDNPATHVMFQAFRNNTVGNCVLIDSVECQWKERISLREGRGGAVTRLERALHPAVRQVMTPDASDSPISFAPLFNVPIQPDGGFDSVKITHEVVFTIEYFATPLAEQVTKELVVVPVRFLASTALPPAPPVFAATSSYFPPGAGGASAPPPPSPSDTTATTTTTTTTTATTARDSHDSRSSLAAPPSPNDLRSVVAGPQQQPILALPRAASPQPHLLRTQHLSPESDSAPPPPQPSPPQPERSSSTTSHSAGQQYRSEHDFYPAESDELALRSGDVVVIFQSFDDGWASGRNLRTGAEGFFPVNALEGTAWSVSEAAKVGLQVPPVLPTGRLATCKRQASRLPGARRARPQAGTGEEGTSSSGGATAAALPRTTATARDAPRNGPSTSSSSSASSVTAVDSSSSYRHSSVPAAVPAQPQSRNSVPPIAPPQSSSSFFAAGVPQVHVTVPTEPWQGDGVQHHSSPPPPPTQAPATPGNNDASFIPTHLVHGYDRETGLPTPRFEYEPPQLPPASPADNNSLLTAVSNAPSVSSFGSSPSAATTANYHHQHQQQNHQNTRPFASEPLTPASPAYTTPSQASSTTTTSAVTQSQSVPSSQLPSPHSPPVYNGGGGGSGGGGSNAAGSEGGEAMSTLDQINMYALQASQQHEQEQQEQQLRQQMQHAQQHHALQSFGLANPPQMQFWDPHAQHQQQQHQVGIDRHHHHNHHQQHAVVAPPALQSYQSHLQHRPTSFLPAHPVPSQQQQPLRVSSPGSVSSSSYDAAPGVTTAAGAGAGGFLLTTSSVNAVAMPRTSTIMGASPPPLQTIAMTVPPQAARTYRTVREFRPQDGGEIELRIGDTLTLEESHPSGWCLGMNLNSGQRGYFPATSVVALEEHQPPQPQLPPPVVIPRPELPHSMSSSSSNHAAHYPQSQAHSPPNPSNGMMMAPPPILSSAEAALPQLQQQHVPGAKPSAESIAVLLQVLDEDMLAGLVDPQSYVESRRRLLTAMQAQKQQHR
ncbi:LIM and SH3 domain protein 1 [Geranomyces variabilis]|nr:LIM and SH3 domain protein 1 [Geranomyces variabilis]